MFHTMDFFENCFFSGLSSHCRIISSYFSFRLLLCVLLLCNKAVSVFTLTQQANSFTYDLITNTAAHLVIEHTKFVSSTSSIRNEKK